MMSLQSRIGRLTAGAAATQQTTRDKVRRQCHEHHHHHKHNDNHQQQQQQLHTVSPPAKQQTQSPFRVGQRVKVPSLSANGTIRYLGEIAFKPGIWVGIQLDIVGTGKNDGSIKENRYFDCPKDTGLFVLSSKIAALRESVSTTIETRSKSRAAGLAKPKTPTRAPAAVVQTKSTPTTTIRARPSTTPAANKKSMTPASSKSSSNTNKTRIVKAEDRPANQKSRSSTTTTTTTTKRRLSSSASRPTTPVSPSFTGKREKIKTQPQHQGPACTPLATPPTSPRKMMTPHAKATHTPTTASSRQRMTSTAPASITKSKSTNTTTAGNKKATEAVRGAPTGVRPRSKVVTQADLQRMQALLDESYNERKRLSEAMTSKEAVWERLVTSKESYALQVEEREQEIQQLRRTLDNAEQKLDAYQKQQQEQQQQQQQLLKQAETSNSSWLATAMDSQWQQRIDKLEKLVKEWQDDAQASHQQLQTEQRQHKSQVDQLRRELADRDCTISTIEKETGIAAQKQKSIAHALEARIRAMDDSHQHQIMQKDAQIQHLHRIIQQQRQAFDADPLVSFYRDTSMLPTIHEDQNHINDNNNGTSSPIPIDPSPRQRLEKQLEISTRAIDDLHQQQKQLMLENDTLRDQLQKVLQVSQSAEQQVKQLQKELAKEIEDKRRVMEDRDTALELRQEIDTQMDMVAASNERLETRLEQETQRVAELEAILAQINSDTRSRSNLSPSSTLSSGNSSVAFSEIDHQHQLLSPTWLVSEKQNTLDSIDTHIAKSHTLYCELCEHSGHDVLSCNMFQSLPLPTCRTYCVNCDIYDAHATNDCPSHDETF